MTGHTIVVTGGSGFVGGALARALAARGHRVRAVQRSDVPGLRAAGIEVVRADLADAAAVHAALRGATAVCHVAALAAAWGNLSLYHAANVTATENVIAACQAEGIRVLVFTSTPSIVHSNTDMAGVDESVPIATQHSSHYAATKAAAEALVLAANGPQLATVALRPHAIWGPGDTTLMPRILLRAQTGHLRLIGDGSNLIDATYIDNAVAAHVLALDKLLTDGPDAACAGHAYFIANGQPAPISELINGLLAAAGLPPCNRFVPASVARGMASMFERMWTALELKGEPWLTRYMVDMLSTTHWYDLSAARRDLGYQPAVSTAEGLKRLAKMLQAEATDEM